MKYTRVQNRDFLMVLPHVGNKAADDAIVALAKKAYPELNRGKVSEMDTNNNTELRRVYGSLIRRGPDL